MSDLLNMEYINRLPHPLIVRFFGGSEWPVHEIDVETGLIRFDVIGLLEIKHIGEARFFIDADGMEHEAESFYAAEKEKP